MVQLAPGHGSSTTIAGAIALPGYENSCVVEGWSVQLNVLLPEAVEAAVKVHLQRRVPLRHARLRVQTFPLIDQGVGFAIAAADAATEAEGDAGGRRREAGAWRRRSRACPARAAGARAARARARSTC